MPSTFLGINIGQSALAAAQAGQDVTGQNIANAATPGYSVQSITQQAADALGLPDMAGRVNPGMLGTGVVASSVTRSRDQFLDVQVRSGLSQQGLYTAQQNALGQVEGAYGEPSSQGLGNALSTFFQNFNDLANNPEDMGARAAVIQGGVALSHVFQNVQGSLTVISQQLAGKVTADQATLQSDSQQVATLNLSIRQAVAQGQTPNDLMDQRDLLVDKMASLANISVLNKADGTVDVSIGGTSLVSGSDFSQISFSGPGSLSARGDLKGGELAGLAQAQSDLTGYQTNLDHLAATVVHEVNTQHAKGFDLNGNAGGAFFSTTGTTAATISVDPGLAADPSKLAAALPAAGTAPAPGDGSNAIAMAGLADQATTTEPISNGAGDPQAIRSFYQGQVATLGSQSAAAKTAAASAQINVQHLTSQRDSVSGVSTDSEMVNMLKYQRSYEAAARVVQTADQMLTTLITGLFGH